LQNSLTPFIESGVEEQTDSVATLPEQENELGLAKLNELNIMKSSELYKKCNF